MLKQNTPFSKDTIIYLKRGMYTSFTIACITGLSFILLFIYNFYTLGIKISIGFIGILFFGVGIALYLLKELFKEAIEYKEENNLSEEELKNKIWEDIKEINKEVPNYQHIKNLIITDEPMIKTSTAKVKRYEEIKKIING